LRVGKLNCYFRTRIFKTSRGNWGSLISRDFGELGSDNYGVLDRGCSGGLIRRLLKLELSEQRLGLGWTVECFYKIFDRFFSKGSLLSSVEWRPNGCVGGCT